MPAVSYTTHPAVLHSWFDQWGVAQRTRDPTDQIYGVARFFAFGGSWHNFYMLTGGNNYGRQAGGEVITAYAPDTAIDYLLLRHEPRYTHYRNFFTTLQRHASALLDSPLRPAQTLQCSGGGAPPSPPSPPAAPVVSTAHCSDDDPAHVGVLDLTQQWSLGGYPLSGYPREAAGARRGAGSSAGVVVARS